MTMAGAERHERGGRPPQGGVMVGGQRYVRAPSPIHFPTDERVPETKRHLELRTLLYQFLKLGFSQSAAIGSDQFVYWDPTSPSACLAPDAFVRNGQPNDLFGSWKVWERGAPHVAVEVVSASDPATWEEKLEKYRRLGVSELVRFDPESQLQPLRVWDLFDGDLLERDLSEPVAQSRFLGGYWLLVPDSELGLTLRLAHDPLGHRLYPSPAEHQAEAHRAEAEARQAAEQRVRELEAELARR